jgi:hypothetical protein
MKKPRPKAGVLIRKVPLLNGPHAAGMLSAVLFSLWRPQSIPVTVRHFIFVRTCPSKHDHPTNCFCSERCLRSKAQARGLDTQVCLGIENRTFGSSTVPSRTGEFRRSNQEFGRMSCGAGVCLPIIMIFRGSADRFVAGRHPGAAHGVVIAIPMHAIADDHDYLLRSEVMSPRSRHLRVFHHHRAIRQLHACRPVGRRQRSAHRTHRPHQQGDEDYVRDGFAELHRVLLSPPGHSQAVTGVTSCWNFF